MPKQSHDQYAPPRLVCHGIFWAHQEICLNDQSPSRFGRNQETGAALFFFYSPHHCSTLSLCKRVRTCPSKRVPLNHKVKLSDPTRTSTFVAPKEAEVAIGNTPMVNLPLVVKPLSPQAEEILVAEASGASSNP